MTVAIMQPYIFPYIGYFQLINAADMFVVYDNIKFTKKGWINRNRILMNGKDEQISIPLKKDSDYLNVVEREIAVSFVDDKVKLLRKISEAYKKAPHYETVFPMISEIINQGKTNLFEFIYASLKEICNYLEIETELIISSEIDVDHSLKSQDKVIALCKALNADRYINPIGGVELYSKEEFKKNNIELRFIKSDPVTYTQFDNEFVPWLSIIDVMMFNSKEQIKKLLNAVSID